MFCFYQQTAWLCDLLQHLFDVARKDDTDEGPFRARRSSWSRRWSSDIEGDRKICPGKFIQTCGLSCAELEHESMRFLSIAGRRGFDEERGMEFLSEDIELILMCKLTFVLKLEIKITVVSLKWINVDFSLSLVF